jgi:hypothetical protein|tara:strand:+ start:321 stop:560 length:240 start_codon:yes stop_codon:yes gene_type:complete
MNKDVTTQAIDVVRENLPEWFRENSWHVIQVCIDNEDWSVRLVEMDREYKDKSYVGLISNIVHDIKGLLQEDEHFLPRI